MLALRAIAAVFQVTFTATTDLKVENLVIQVGRDGQRFL